VHRHDPRHARLELDERDHLGQRVDVGVLDPGHHAVGLPRAQHHHRLRRGVAHGVVRLLRREAPPRLGQVQLTREELEVGRAGRIDDLQRVELEAHLLRLGGDQLRVAEEDRLRELLLDDDAAGLDDAMVFALGEDDALGLRLGLGEDRAHHVRGLAPTRRTTGERR
jgi:hypothetical protein